MFATRSTVTRKVVTSGRLTGTSKAQADRTRRSPKPRPEPAYSLYSTDSENQVATLHNGLDRCAALLGDILQCENRGAAPNQASAEKVETPKRRPHTPTGKKAIRRSVSKSASNPRSVQAAHRKSITKASAATTTPQRNPAHSGVKLQPPVRRAHHLKTPSKSSSLQPSQPSRAPIAPDALGRVPEKDQGPGAEAGGTMRRVQCLLGELRSLMAGQGGSAQMYLHLLEQTAISALTTGAKNSQTPGTSTTQAEATEAQLQRQINVLNQQQQEQEATQQLLNSQVLSLQGQLDEAEKLLTQTQNTLLETEGKLQSRTEENLALKSELESARGRLKASLQDKFNLERRLQEQQQEVQALQRIIDSLDSSTPTKKPPGLTKEHITHYLLSLEQSHTQAVQGPQQGPQQGPERGLDSALSGWSDRSESSFNTRDEAAFRDGLAALDASIASLQNTLKLDLVKT